MNEDFKKDFFTTQFNYLSGLGFKFGLYKGRYSNSVVFYRETNELESGGHFDKHFKNPEEYTERFLKSSWNLYPNSTSKDKYRQNFEHLLEATVQFFKDFPEHRKDLIKNYEKLIHPDFHFSRYNSNNDSDKGSLHKFIKLAANNAKDALFILQTLPISILETQNIDPKTLIKFFDKFKVSEEERYKFLITFYKNRKNQISQARNGATIRDFLLDYYERDEKKLQPFIEYFPYLKSYFSPEDIPADIFENNYLYSTTSFVNCRKMMKSFCLDNWNESTYEERIPAICEGFKEAFGLGVVYTEIINRSKMIMEVCFLHNDESFDKKTFEERFVKFFRYLQRSGTTHNTPINSDLVCSWVKASILNEKLTTDLHTETSGNTKRKNKI